MAQKKNNSEHLTSDTFVDESDEELVFLDDLPPIENDLWKWVVLLVSSVQSMVIIGIISSAGVYLEPTKEVQNSHNRNMFQIHFIFLCLSFCKKFAFAFLLGISPRLICTNRRNLFCIQHNI